MRKLTIACDFDNTITMGGGRFPECGKLRTEAKAFISEWFEKGHTIIINSCRSINTQPIAEEFLKKNLISYNFFNENDPEIIAYWKTDTRKISADLYFDDRGGVVNWKCWDEMVKQYEKPLILCIVGESGSGKSLVADYIKDVHGIQMIESRTTRQRRSENEMGHTFISKEEFDGYRREDMIAFTTFGTDDYCCLKQDVKIRNTYVIDEKGLNYLQENFSDQYRIESIRIYRPIDTRIREVGEERVSRDIGKFTMSRWEFDYRINNEFGKDFLLAKIDSIITDNMLYI